MGLYIRHTGDESKLKIFQRKLFSIKSMKLITSRNDNCDKVERKKGRIEEGWRGTENLRVKVGELRIS